MTRVLSKKQRGFTLVELLVTVAIIGTIGTSLGSVIMGMMNNTGDNNARVQALSQTESAAHLITEDGMSAQSAVIPVDGNSVTLTWQSPADLGAHTYKVEYALAGAAGTDLQRRYWVDTVLQSTRTVAEDVTDIEFTPSGDVDAFKVIISTSGGGTRISETRAYNITLRLD